MPHEPNPPPAHTEDHPAHQAEHHDHHARGPHDAMHRHGHHPPPPEVQAILHDIFGASYMPEMHLFRRLKGTAHLMGSLTDQFREHRQLSSARVRLLTRLVVDQRLGNTDGTQPSELSRFLGVSRNTVSALLNGLEEQQLIERRLHPSDRRKLLIHITHEGQDVVDDYAPQMAAFVARLFDPLSPEERGELLRLLDKLFAHLIQQAEVAEAADAAPPEPSDSEQPDTESDHE